MDVLVKLDFDTCMASMCAERFMREVLVDALDVKLLGVGYDHRFGKPCEGECLEQYVSYGNALGVEVIGLSPFTLDGDKVSSTVVRKALAAGDVVQANSLLGYNYRLTGCVVTGAGIGRGFGFPTANVQLCIFILECILVHMETRAVCIRAITSTTLYTCIITNSPPILTRV